MEGILVVEDDDAVLDIVKRMLEQAGYAVRTANNGNEAIRRCLEEPADLVITDILMPAKEGIETIYELRRHFPGIKIIAISGGGRLPPESYLELAKRIGAFRTLTKPLGSRELIGAVRELLGTGLRESPAPLDG